MWSAYIQMSQFKVSAHESSKYSCSLGFVGKMFHTEIVPPGFNIVAALAQNFGISNQWIYVELANADIIIT
jgi:hypothetical protein